jgi:hypothetical protein
VKLNLRGNSLGEAGTAALAMALSSGVQWAHANLDLDLGGSKVDPNRNN